MLRSVTRWVPWKDQGYECMDMLEDGHQTLEVLAESGLAGLAMPFAQDPNIDEVGWAPGTNLGAEELLVVLLRFDERLLEEIGICPR